MMFAQLSSNDIQNYTSLGVALALLMWIEMKRIPEMDRAHRAERKADMERSDQWRREDREARHEQNNALNGLLGMMGVKLDKVIDLLGAHDRGWRGQ